MAVAPIFFVSLHSLLQRTTHADVLVSLNRNMTSFVQGHLNMGPVASATTSSINRFNRWRSKSAKQQRPMRMMQTLQTIKDNAPVQFHVSPTTDWYDPVLIRSLSVTCDWNDDVKTWSASCLLWSTIKFEYNKRIKWINHTDSCKSWITLNKPCYLALVMTFWHKRQNNNKISHLYRIRGGLKGETAVFRFKIVQFL